MPLGKMDLGHDAKIKLVFTPFSFKFLFNASNVGPAAPLPELITIFRGHG